MVSMFLKRLSKVRKTQFLSFSIKFSFLLRDKIHPRRTPVFSKFASEFGAQGRFSPLAGFVRLSGGCLPVPAIFSYPLRGCKETHVSLQPLFASPLSGDSRIAATACRVILERRCAFRDSSLRSRMTRKAHRSEGSRRANMESTPTKLILVYAVGSVKAKTWI